MNLRIHRPHRKVAGLWSRVLESSTKLLLRRAGVGVGAQCLDVGCGEGAVTQLISRLVGAGGSAIGIDRDEDKLEVARESSTWKADANINFQAVSLEDFEPGRTFDFVYSRFLLSQTPDPAGCLKRLLSLTASNGGVVLEDMQFSGAFCHPPSAAFDRYVELCQQFCGAQGGNADIGPRLPELLRQAGCRNVHLRVVQPSSCRGDIKRLPAEMLNSMRPALISAGLSSEDEITSLVADLQTQADDPHSIGGMPRIFQAWGYKS